MTLTPFIALVKRDLLLYAKDRRAVIMSLVAPIVIGSFFGYLFKGAADNVNNTRIRVAVVDQDGGDISRALVTALRGDTAIEVQESTEEAARTAVRNGKIPVAAVLPKGLGDLAVRALFRGGEKPEVRMLFDPSHDSELAMVRGLMTQHVMEVVTREAMGSNSQKYLDQAIEEAQSSGMNPTDRQALMGMLGSLTAWNQRLRANPDVGARGGGFSMPYNVRTEAVTASKGAIYNAFSHSFAGMSVQFILMMGVDAGLLVIMQRRLGIWKRLRAAPVSRLAIVSSRVVSATIIGVFILFVVFGFARVAFNARVEGSLAGFVGVCVAFSLMTAAFGLLVAVSGKTPEATRGLAILVTLLLVMIGGSWVPAFLFPQWLQKASFAVPTRWAMEGLDAMTWRGLGFDAAVAPIAALAGFAMLFGALAVWRFRWDA